MKAKFNITKILKAIIAALFIVYIAALFKIVLLRHIPIVNLFDGKYIPFRSVNLIPFKTVWEFSYVYSHGNQLRAMANILGNIIIFMPFGYFVCTLSKKDCKLYNILADSFCFSLFFEITQYVLGLGSSDIDDIILNTLGGVLGYIIYKIFMKITHEKNALYISICLLTMFTFIGGYIVAQKEFGTDLGITQLHEQVIGGENVPKRKADVFGRFVKGNDNIININKIVKSNGKIKEDRNKVEVVLNNSTKIYSEKGSLVNNNFTINYKRVSKKDMTETLNKKNTTLAVWGKSINKKVFSADVITIHSYDDEK